MFANVKFFLFSVLFFPAAFIAGAQNLAPADASLISCTASRVVNGKVSGVVPLPAGSVIWKTENLSLERFDRVAFELGGFSGKSLPGSFGLAFRADGKYHFASYAEKPVISGKKVKLVFNIGKTYRKNVVAVRLYFNRSNIKQDAFDFTIEKVRFFKNAPAAGNKTVSKLPFVKHRRNFARTMIFPRIQIKYGLYLNYHAPGVRDIWLDRPLDFDRSLAGSLRSYDKSGNFESLRKDAATLLSYADGMGILATSRSYLERTVKAMDYADQAGLKNFWLLEVSPALTNLHNMSGDGDCSFIADMLKYALKSPSAFRYNGKLVISSYNANALPPEKWVPILQELRRIANGQVLFVAEIRPLFYQAANEYGRNGGHISVETHEKMKKFIRSYLDVADGVSFAGCNHLADKTSDMSNTRFAHKFYENILLPTLVSICNEPEYRGKLLGVSAAKGYFYRKNATSGQNEEGTLTLRRSLAAALAVEPDFILMPEWNEANENTHIQPTVYDSFASRRVINHFRGIRGTAEDNTALPDLIVSYRREIVRGEILTVEILNIPDKRFKAEKITFQLKFKDVHGNEIMDFGRAALDPASLGEKRYDIPSEKFTGQRLIVPELLWYANGKSGKFDGLAAILLDTPPTMNKKYIKQPLRDLIPMDKVNVQWSADAAAVKVTGSVASQRKFRSIELLQNTFPVDALDLHGEYACGRDNMTLSLIWNSFSESAAVLRIRNIRGESEGIDDKSIHLAEFSRSAVRKDNGIITKKLNFVQHQNMFNFKTSADAVLEISLDDQKFTVNAADIARNGVYRKVFPDGKTIQLEPKKCNFTMPYSVGCSKADFTLSAPRLDPSAVYSLRAITEDGKIYHSAPFYPQKLSGKKLRSNVWSFSTLQPVSLSLPQEFVRSVDYDFTADTGDLLLTGDRFYHALAGGGNHSLHLLGRSAVDSAPEKITYQGEKVLRFDGRNNVLTVPKLLISEQTLRIKFTIMPENRRDQVILNAGYTFDQSLWCHLKEGKIYGGFRNRKNVIARFSTAPLVKYGEWNDIEIRYDLKELTILCNGQVAAKVKCRGLMYKQSDLFFGGMDQKKEPLPRFQGLLKSLTVANCL